MKMAISVTLLAAVLLSLCVSSLHSAPSRRNVINNSCQGYVLDPERSPGDRLYDALYISKRLTLASILEKKDEKLRFYQSLERIANGALSEEVDGSESVGQALKQVVTQLAKDACTWVVQNETETLIVNCDNLTDIVRCARDRRIELIETFYLNTTANAASLAVQVLPEIDDMLSEINRTVLDVVHSRRAWVAAHISQEYQSYVCSEVSS